MGLWLAAALVLGAGGGGAGETPQRRVTLGEALDYARAHQPTLQAARARAEAARRDVDAARAAWLPSVGALAELVGGTANNSTATVLANGAVDLPRVGSTRVAATPDWAPAASTLLAVGLRQQLWDFGRTGANVAQARAAAELEEARSRGAGLDVELAVPGAFFSVRAAAEVLEASRQAAARATAHRNFAQSAVKAQLRPPIELTRAEADLARAEVAELRAEGMLRSAQVALASAVGVPEPSLDAVDGEDAALPPLLDAAQARERALAQDPLLQQAKAAADLQHARVDLLDAQSRPSLFLTAAVSGRNGGAAPSSGAEPWGAGLVPLVPNYSAGLVVSWPLFDGVTRARAESARAFADAADADVAVVRDRASQVVLLAVERARLADGSMDALARAADAARANAAQAEARFGAGLGTSLELADAETLRTEADINLALGRFEARIARYALARAMGEAQ